MRRTLDWKFFAALSVFLMVCYYVTVGVHAVREDARKGRVVERLSQERRDAETAAAAARLVATRERQKLIRNQGRVLRQLEQLQQQLKSQGIVLRLERTTPTPSDTPTPRRSRAEPTRGSTVPESGSAGVVPDKPERDSTPEPATPTPTPSRGPVRGLVETLLGDLTP